MQVKVLRKTEMETRSGRPGLTGTYVGLGINAKLGKFSFKKGTKVGTHKHDKSEQISYILKGRLKVIANGQEFIVSEGDSYLIPSGLEHSLEAQEETVSIDVWSPPT